MTTTSSSPTRAPSAAADPVRFLDLAGPHAELGGALEAAAARVVASGWYVLGPEVERFEAAWAAHVGARHAIGVGSGLDALALALAALGVGPGDEVIVPGHTFIATWLAVQRVGATPVPVDAAPGSFDMDLAGVEAAITDRTAALVPVHLYGAPADLDGMLALARRHGLAVVDDAAQAHGATHRDRPIGALCDATAWSFYPGKNLGALGDGGAITTDDDTLAARLRRLRNYGSEQKYVHVEPGWNTRLDELQAALLSVKLTHLAAWNDRRRALAARYDDALAGLSLVLPPACPHGEPVHHLYVVQAGDRDALREDLAARGIETGVHYPIACHRQQAFASTTAAAAELPRSEALAAHVLSLPMGPHLRPGDVDRVCAALCELLA